MLSSEGNLFAQAGRYAVFALLAGAGVFAGYRIANIPGREEIVFYTFILAFLPLLKFHRTGLYALLILPPLVPFIRRIFYLAYSRPETDMLILLPDLLLVLTLIGFFFATAGEREEDESTRKIGRLVVIYVAYLFLRVFVFNDAPVKDVLLKFKFYGPFALTFFLGAASAGNPSFLRRFGAITLVIGVGGALYGIKQLYFGFSTAENLWLQSVPFQSLFIGNIARPYSIFASPAAFADMAQISIFASLAVLALSRGITGRLLAVLTIGLFGYALLMTSVRSSWIGAVAGFVFWFLIFRKQGSRARVLNLVLILAVFAGGLFGNDYIESLNQQSRVAAMLQNEEISDQNKIDLLVKQRLSAVTNPLQEHSMESRLALWKMIFYYSTEPAMGLFGRGLGQLSADSLYVTYLAEFGYPGFFLLLWILIAIVRAGFRVYDRLQTPLMKATARAILTFNFVFMVVNITGIHIHNYPGDFYFWFCNGILLKLHDAERLLEEQNEIEPKAA